MDNLAPALEGWISAYIRWTTGTTNSWLYPPILQYVLGTNDADPPFGLWRLLLAWYMPDYLTELRTLRQLYAQLALEMGGPDIRPALYALYDGRGPGGSFYPSAGSQALGLGDYWSMLEYEEHHLHLSEETRESGAHRNPAEQRLYLHFRSNGDTGTPTTRAIQQFSMRLEAFMLELRTQQGLDDNRMQVGPVQDLPLNLPDNVTNRMVAQLLQLSPARRPGAPQILQAGPVTSAELRPRPHGPYSPVQVGRRRDTSERSVETSGGLPLGARPSTSLDASVGHPPAPPGAASPRQTRSSSSSSSSAAVAPPSPPTRRHQGPRRR